MLSSQREGEMQMGIRILGFYACVPTNTMLPAGALCGEIYHRPVLPRLQVLIPAKLHVSPSSTTPQVCATYLIHTRSYSHVLWHTDRFLMSKPSWEGVRPAVDEKLQTRRAW